MTTTKKNDFTFMTTCGVSAGKEHCNSTEVDQLLVAKRVPTPGSFCGNNYDGENHGFLGRKDLLDDDGNMKVATTNRAKSSGDEATPTTMRMRQRGWGDASAGANMTKEEPNNMQP
eukprot:7761552-Ditylum_brightwellii.AAC.2